MSRTQSIPHFSIPTFDPRRQSSQSSNDRLHSNERNGSGSSSAGNRQTSSDFADLLNSAQNFSRLENGYHDRNPSRHSNHTPSENTPHTNETATEFSAEQFADSLNFDPSSADFTSATASNASTIQGETFSDQIRFSKKIDDAEIVAKPSLNDDQFRAAQDGETAELEDISEITQPGFLMSKLSQLGYNQPIAIRA